jgi:hypothetical protein
LAAIQSLSRCSKPSTSNWATGSRNVESNADQTACSNRRGGGLGRQQAEEYPLQDTAGAMTRPVRWGRILMAPELARPGGSQMIVEWQDHCTRQQNNPAPCRMLSNML